MYIIQLIPAALIIPGIISVESKLEFERKSLAKND